MIHYCIGILFVVWSFIIIAVEGDFQMFCTAPELIRINIIHIFNDVFTMLVICICSPSLSVKSLCQIPIECVESYWSSILGPQRSKKKKEAAWQPAHKRKNTTGKVQLCCRGFGHKVHNIELEKRKLVTDRIDVQEEAAGLSQNKQGQWMMTKKDCGIC